MKEHKIEKDFIINGFRCIILGHKLGHRCGYIEIPEDCELYGNDYNYINNFINVHGGWTYSEYAAYNYPAKSSTNSFWIGFDCAHWGDAKDIELIKSFGDDVHTDLMIKMQERFPEHGEIRSTEYVENELVNAVKQIIQFNNRSIDIGCK